MPHSWAHVPPSPLTSSRPGSGNSPFPQQTCLFALRPRARQRGPSPSSSQVTCPYLRSFNSSSCVTTITATHGLILRTHWGTRQEANSIEGEGAMGPSGGALTAGREDCDGGRPSLPSLGHSVAGQQSLHPVLWVMYVSPEMLRDWPESNKNILCQLPLSSSHQELGIVGSALWVQPHLILPKPQEMFIAVDHILLTKTGDNMK